MLQRPIIILKAVVWALEVKENLFKLLPRLICENGNHDGKC